MACPFVRPKHLGECDSETFVCDPPTRREARAPSVGELSDWCLSETGFTSCPDYLACVAAEGSGPFTR